VLLLNLAWILSPATFGLPDAVAAIKLSFVSVAVWWLVFTLPLLLRVPEPRAVLEVDEAADANPVRVAVRRVIGTFHELRSYRQAFLMLVAFLLYNDGIQTIIRMAAIYGAEVGIDRNAQIAAFVVVQFVGVPFSFLFGALADRIGAKPSLFAALTVYTGISVLAYFMTTAWHFFVLAFLVGMVQGGSQALSRSLFARMIPKHKSSEYFGFYSVLRDVRDAVRIEQDRGPLRNWLLHRRRARAEPRQHRRRRGARRRRIGGVKRGRGLHFVKMASWEAGSRCSYSCCSSRRQPRTGAVTTPRRLLSPHQRRRRRSRHRPPAFSPPRTACAFA
jgi:hypothetical protein